MFPQAKLFARKTAEMRLDSSQGSSSGTCRLDLLTLSTGTLIISLDKVSIRLLCCNLSIFLLVTDKGYSRLCPYHVPLPSLKIICVFIYNSYNSCQVVAIDFHHCFYIYLLTFYDEEVEASPYLSLYSHQFGQWLVTH